MKKVLIYLLCALGVMHVKAQQLINNEFEIWENFGMYDDLSDWSTLNYLSSFGYDVGTKKIAGKRGNGVELLSVGSNVASFPVPGIISTGKLPQNQGPDVESMLIPFSARPVYINLWFQSLPKQGDSVGLIMVLTKYNELEGRREIIAETGFATADSISEWTERNLIFNYYSFEMPDSAYLIASSSINSNDVYIGSIFRLDEINLVYNGLTKNIDNFDEKLNIFPNPSNSTVYIETNNKIDKVEIIGIDGKVYSIEINENKIDMSNLESGVYFIRIQIGENFISKKVIKI